MENEVESSIVLNSCCESFLVGDTDAAECLLEYADSGINEDIELKYDISPEVKQESLQNEFFVPIGIFNNESLSALEAISKFLKEEKGLRYCEIAGILNRDDRTIWGAHNIAKKKMGDKFACYNSNLAIPLTCFEDRMFGALESIVKYLREEKQMRYCKIASLLNRDDRTIWTVYSRVRKKTLARRNEAHK